MRTRATKGAVESTAMIAYVARELGTGRTLSAHDDVQLPAYSTIKVLLAAAFWRMVAAGELDEAQPYCFEPGSCVGGSGVLRGLRHAAELSLADVMHLALVVSDNDAANIIAGVVGLERVNELAAELGLTQTRMQRLMMDQAAVAAGRENFTSAGDLARLLEELREPRGARAARRRARPRLAGAAGAPRRDRPLPAAGGVLRGQVRRRFARGPVRPRLRARVHRPTPGGARGDDARLGRLRDGRAHRSRAVRGARRGPRAARALRVVADGCGGPPRLSRPAAPPARAPRTQSADRRPLRCL